MPQAIWKGSISFGLVSIPVKLFSAVSRKTVHFNQIDTRSQSRVRQRRVSEADGSEVPFESIAKGYQLPSGEYVIITDDELAALDPAKTRVLEIEQFVDLDAIDPTFFDSAYVIAPDPATVKPYALLQRALAESGKVGIGRFVMRTKEYLAAVRPVDGTLMLSTMVYADEINDREELGDFEAVSAVEVTDKEVGMARQLIESLTEEFQPEEFTDSYRQQVLDLINRKASGATELTATVEEEGPSADVVDLMAALEKSVAAAKQARGRHPTGKGDDAEATADAGDGDEDEAEKVPVKKKAAAKKKPARLSRSA